MTMVVVGLELKLLYMFLCFVQCRAHLDLEGDLENTLQSQIELQFRKSAFFQKGVEQLPSEAENVTTLESDYYRLQHHEKKCPTWMYPNNVSSESVCQCGNDIEGAVKCNATLKEVSIIDSYCMTYDNHRKKAVVGECFYGLLDGSVYRRLPFNVSQLNEAMCGKLNRRGRLCSKCKKRHFPLVYSYGFQCIRCNSSNYNWAKYIAIATLPTTSFYFLVLFFRINALSPQLHMLVQIIQICGSAVNLRPLLYLTHQLLLDRLIAVPYGIASLDFVRTFVNSICVDLTILQTRALDYITAIYPLILVLTTYIFVELHARNFRLIVWIWTPFSTFLAGRLNWDVHSSIVKVFSTFLLLSYGKLLNVTFDILLPTRLYNIRGEFIGFYLYYDASYKYFRHEHLPYAILALFIISLFLVPPPLILLLCLTKSCRKHLNARGLALQAFVDCFYGYYKDGTEPGTRDCRWFPAMWFILKSIAIFVLFGISKNILCYILLIIFVIGIAMIVVIFKPYKLPYSKYNTIDAVLLLIVAMWLASVTFLKEALILRSRKLITLGVSVSTCLSLLPLFYMCLLLTYWLYKKCLRTCCNKCLQKLNNGHRELKFYDSSLISAMEQERGLFGHNY